MKNKKRMKEKKISNFMWDKVRDFSSESKLNKESKRNFADKNCSQDVLSLTITKNKMRSNLRADLRDKLIINNEQACEKALEQ